MKRVIVIVNIILLVGCSLKENQYEKIMKEYANTYYDLHKKGTVNLEKTEISIKDLRKGNEYAGDSFDLEKLSKCSEESYVELIIEGNEIKEYKFHMECGK